MGESTQAAQVARSLEQLLSLHDEEFVRCAYVTVLRRPADPTGFGNYLSELRRGISKEKIVAELASSPEGQGLRHELPGLGELLRRIDRDEKSFLPRLRRQLGWQSREPFERQLRRMENTLFRMGAESALRLDRIETEFANVKQLLRQGRLVSSRDTAEGVHDDLHVGRSSVVANPVVLTDPSPQRVMTGIASHVAESQEAHQMLVATRNLR